jgi:hypothetical protein
MTDAATASVTLPTTVLSETKRKLLERYMSGCGSHAQGTPPVIVRRPPGEQAPLSLVQEQVWHHASATNRVSSFYNESITIHRTGDMDRTVLEHSLAEIIRRHEVWRTTFDTIEGQPSQVIHPALSKVEIPLIDLRRIPKALREREALRLASEDARRPFDLKKGPLVRALLATFDDRTHRLFLTMHQTVTDGVSVYQILPTELTILYAAFCADEPSPLPNLALQYADVAYSERQLLKQGVFEKQLAYWQNQLAGELPFLQWPRERVRTTTPSFRGAIHAFTLPQPLRDGLRDLSQREGVTLFTTLLAGFTALRFRYTEQEDIITGTVAPAGRKRLEVRKLLGYFLNPVTLRIDLSGDPTVRELLQQCREVTFGALSNDDVPLEYLMERLRPKLPRHLPFNVAITLAPPLPELNPGWNQTPMDVDSGWAKWDLYLELSDRPTEIVGRAQYSTDIFTPSSVAGLLQDFRVILEALTRSPERLISDLPCFSGK